jgi:hypothetical protein
MRIDAALAEIRSAAEMLREQFPGIDSDETAWMDNLEGCTSAVGLAEHLAERTIYLLSLQAAALDRAKQLQARARRFEAEEERLRSILLALVDAAGGTKMVFSGCTLSPRNTPARVIANDASLTPDEYMVETVSKKPDAKAIKDAIELGAEIPGWYKNQGGRSLSILVR